MTRPADPSAAAAECCYHCGAPVPAAAAVHVRLEGQARTLCCQGCAAVAQFIIEGGLGRFYQFRAGESQPPAAPALEWRTYDREAALERFTHRCADGTREVAVQLEGLHCAACVWLVRRALERRGGVREVSVGLSERRALVRFDPARVPLSELLRTLSQLGLAPRPLAFTGGGAPEQAERRTALKRLAVAAFGMMQVMTFAVALYLSGGTMAPGLEQLMRLGSLIVATPVVLYAAQPFFAAAARALRAKRLGMDVPVALSIATAYGWSVWATLRGHGAVYFDSAVMFTFFLLLGRFIEMQLRHRSGQQQEALQRLLPESTLRLAPGPLERVTPDELSCGDRLRVLVGERIPADGEITAGSSEVDESLLTGESSPRACQPGARVIGGSLNLSGVLEITVTRVGAESTLAAVSRLLDRAAATRPRIAQLADRIAGSLIAGILLLSVATALYWWHADPAKALPAALAVLVVTCPCALSLATPAALAAASARLGRCGLLVSRSRALEQLAHADCVVFDKTGTLTCGKARIESLTLLDPRAEPARCRAIAAALESCSAHPLARAFLSAATPDAVSQVRVQTGGGVAGCVAGRRYRIGSLSFVLEGCRQQPAPPPALPAQHTAVYLADAEGLLAVFGLADELRPDALAAIAELRRLGLNAQIASGDRQAVVEACARELELTVAHAQLSAADKLELVRTLQGAGHRVLVVGDGVNDAPVLASADVSVAIAGGADLARVSADLVLLGGLAALPEAVRTARRTLGIIRQNLLWAALYNLSAVPLAASGALAPWVAALGMSASSLLVVINALRLLPRAASARAAPVPPPALPPAVPA